MGHVAWFQEYWILRKLEGAASLLERGDEIYDAFNVSYKLRWSHEFPSRDETLAYADQVLERCVARLRGEPPTPEDSYFYELAALHEGMHSENLLGVRQALGYPRPSLLQSQTPIDVEADYVPHDVHVPAGTYRLGAEPETGFVFDNEKWAHDVTLDAFAIRSVPVTNAEFAAFVDAGGYTTRRFWTKHAWEWRRRAEAEAPVYWARRNGTWQQRVFDTWEPLDPRAPVSCLNWYEANAYCAFAERRLPTEAEWEVAAAFDPATGRQRRQPWGDGPPTAALANLDYMQRGVVDVAAYPAGDSPLGCRQMIGNVWEWTSSVFEPYPGFEPDPYAEYSQPYFGKKPVLRGGCFATQAVLIRNTWRNFFIRHRRNVFAGFRTCAL